MTPRFGRFRRLGPALAVSAIAFAVPSHSAEPPVSWQHVDMQTTCATNAPAGCLNLGLRVDFDGRYSAGAGKDGRSRKSQLPDEDLRVLRQAVDRVVRSAGPNPPGCSAKSSLPGEAQTVTIVSAAGELRLQGAGGKFDSACAPGDAAAGQALFSLVDELMRRYSPSPF